MAFVFTVPLKPRTQAYRRVPRLSAGTGAIHLVNTGQERFTSWRGSEVAMTRIMKFICLVMVLAGSVKGLGQSIASDSDRKHC